MVKISYSVEFIFTMDDIDIIPFEQRFQEEVVQLFRDGLSPKSYDLGPTVTASEKWFVESKLSKEKGDMYDIWNTYMKSESSKDQNSSGQNYFWVAFHRKKQMVVGHVGVIMSTYELTDSFIYHSPELNPLNVCELVRMGVHINYRGRGIGKRLCETVQEYALKQGMKQVVLSTLEKKILARKMYEKYGFKFVYKTKFPIEQLLGAGDWEELNIVHYIKQVTNRDTEAS